MIRVVRLCTVMLYFLGGGGGGGAEGCGEEVGCGNVPVKNNANRFLLQKAISIPFHGLVSSSTLKPVKSVISMCNQMLTSEIRK